jgi:hypothetical protein
MMYLRKLTPFLLLAALGGCATLPTGPSVNVLPAQGKSFEKFRTEDETCRQWAERQLGMPTQEGYDQNVATGAVAGTAVGAGLGAAIGSASGHAGAGAAIGAASGLLFGSAAGSNAGDRYGRESQRRYDNAYVQCMYSYGNQVPGARRAAAPPRQVAPPPPPPVAYTPPPPPPVVYTAPAPVVYAPPPVAYAPPPPPMLEPQDYPPPPEVYFEQAPQFIYSPSLNMYVAVGVPYDIFYTGNEYFYFHGGRWYRGPYYDGPWSFAPRRAYPPVLLRYKIDHIRHYRDVEYRRYQHDRVHYAGRFHRPERHERRIERKEERREERREDRREERREERRDQRR